MYGTITAKDGLRLRKTPNPKAVTLDLMPFGDRVEMLGEGVGGGGGGLWVRIAWLPAKGARLEGWAAAEYIRLDQPKPCPAPPIEPEVNNSVLGLILVALTVAGSALMIWMGFR